MPCPPESRAAFGTSAGRGLCEPCTSFSTQALADTKDRAACHRPTEAARVDSEGEHEVPEEHEEAEARSGESCGVGIAQDACGEGRAVATVIGLGLGL